MFIMEQFNLTQSFVEVTVADIKPGDTVYISNKPDSVPYYVLDVGSPFILIENTKSHFASMFRVTKNLYKLQ